MNNQNEGREKEKMDKYQKNEKKIAQEETVRSRCKQVTEKKEEQGDEHIKRLNDEKYHRKESG